MLGNMGFLVVSQFVEEFLLHYRVPVHLDYPGNVRELENIIERAIVLCYGDTIGVEHLPEKIAKRPSPGNLESPSIPEEGVSLSEAVSAYERQMILQALEKTGWVKNRAAKLLKMNRTTLVEKIKKQGIERPAKPA